MQMQQLKEKLKSITKTIVVPINELRKRLMTLEILLSILIGFTPAILIWLDGSIRISISNYAYSSKSEWFVFLMTLAASMFIYNGTAWKTKWYNIILGITLAGIVLTPHLQFETIHLIFAIIFFAGSVFVMIYFSSKKQRLFKIIAGVFLLVGIAGYYVFNWYSLFWAEWIGMLPICVHFIGESIGKID
ncbi:hypothetical protein [uncultured Algibacter sp.]|uniref:DUF7103 family protein n=1 Tax=uncultured Algibacter sp. TaxID=298659 RepID=UPI0030EC1C37